MNDLRPDTAAVGVGDQEEVAELQAKIPISCTQRNSL